MERLDLPMLRARFVVPAAVFALSAINAVLPSITSAQAASVPVSIVDGGDMPTWGYGPNSTTVTVGQTVTWTNTGTSPHDATSTDGTWQTPLLQSGQSASVTFTTPGTFAYSCVLHPWMQGTIIVTPAAGSDSGSGGTVSVAPAAGSDSGSAGTVSVTPAAGSDSGSAGTDSGSTSGN